MPFQTIVENPEQYPVIRLVSDDGEAEIYAYGGILNAFFIHTPSQKLNVIDGFSSVAEAMQQMTPAFKGSFLSPFTCRMNRGNYSFNGKPYHVNKFYLEPHAIHGLVYDAVYTVKDSFAHDTKASVTLEYIYTGADAGYPFPFTITHQWELTTGNRIAVTTTVHHTNPEAIPYAQGWHPYFSLGGPVDEYVLQFNSDTMLEFDDTLLPTGNRIADTSFIEGKSLQGVFLDNCFELLPASAQPACVLSSADLRLTIIPDASYPYLQIYTPPHRNSIAIENLSGAPDAFNNGIGLQLIEPGTDTIFTTSYIISFLH